MGKDVEKKNMNDEEIEEIYMSADKAFDAGKYTKVVKLLKDIPEDKLTIKMIGLLIASNNNLEKYDKAIEYLEKYKKMFESKMRLWFYYAAFAYVYKKDIPKAMEQIEAGIKECNREQKAGILTGQDYQNEIADFEQMRKKCERELEWEKKKSGWATDNRIEKEKRDLEVANRIYDMMFKKEMSDEDIISEIIRYPDVRDIEGFNFVLVSVFNNRFEVTKKLVELGSDINQKTDASLYRGNALNVASSKEQAEWLLEHGAEIEKNLSIHVSNPYVNPAIMAALHNDANMVLYWLDKEKEVFDDEKFIDELYYSVIDKVLIVNQYNTLSVLMRDDKIYETMKETYSKVDNLESIKLYQSSMRKITDEDLEDKKKELKKILSARKKQLA